MQPSSELSDTRQGVHVDPCWLFLPSVRISGHLLDIPGEAQDGSFMSCNCPVPHQFGTLALLEETFVWRDLKRPPDPSPLKHPAPSFVKIILCRQGRRPHKSSEGGRDKWGKRGRSASCK